MINFEIPTLANTDNANYFITKNGCRLFIYDYQPINNYNAAIFIISGITGINHNNEKDIIELLSNMENRVVVIHPRGTGYSEGEKGNISDFSIFINDYIEIIKSDKDYNSKEHKMFLFGHSMSTSVLLAVAEKLEVVGGAILVNPPYLMKKAKGMSPGFGQYVKYAWYYLFKSHTPIVNMAGDPKMMENIEDRIESEQKANDSLLVKYFSMHYMIEVRKLIKSTLEYCRRADYPLLLILGMKDNIVDKKGCDLIFNNWKHPNKNYQLIKNGSHGKSTVKEAKEIINKWIMSN
jgi:alpha-beta hydrolase superfamily lysophospholipase